MPTAPQTHAQRQRANGCRIARPQRKARVYDKRRWRGSGGRIGIRMLQLKREPACRLCGAMACHVDHIVARERGGTDRPDNLQSLCHACHSRKTVVVDGGFGNVKR